MTTHSKISFPGAHGVDLAARLDLPPFKPRGYALFAHCFTCSKDSLAASRISARLSELGFGVLRFDFSGLGQSEGDFSNTNFSSNIEDLVAAARWMDEQGMAPSLAIGHSLGGAAVIAAAEQLPSVSAFAVLGAPSEAGHLERHFADATDQIAERGAAQVELGGRPFLIKQHFLEDIRQSRVLQAASKLARPLLVMHSPVDQIVAIDNATETFLAAKHPKSFVSLGDADHLLTGRKDAEYAAGVIASWAEPYLPEENSMDPADQIAAPVVVAETGWSQFQNVVSTGKHRMFADEPKSLGGEDTGPNPFDFVRAGLGACTSITLRMYANRKNIPLESVSVGVTQDKTEDGEALFNIAIKLEGDLTDEQRARMIEISKKCPVHRLLDRGAQMRTTEST